jgi:hypothetical protein
MHADILISRENPTYSFFTEFCDDEVDMIVAWYYSLDKQRLLRDSYLNTKFLILPRGLDYLADL